MSVRLVEYAKRPPASVNSGHGYIAGSRFFVASSTICAWFVNVTGFCNTTRTCVCAFVSAVNAPSISSRPHFQCKDADTGP
jgi:hypothetical protein